MSTIEVLKVKMNKIKKTIKYTYENQNSRWKQKKVQYLKVELESIKITQFQGNLEMKM